MIFDTHTHTYFDVIASDQDEIIREMYAHGVVYATQIGCNLGTSIQAIGYARRYPEYFATIGIHPSDCPEHDMDTFIHELGCMAEEYHTDIVGIGETGLDYSYPSVGDRQKRIQKALFEAQINLANHHKLPLIIHTRAAAEDTLACLQNNRPEKFVLHCYAEDRTFAETILGMFEHAYFGLSGILTYKKNIALQEAVRYIPLDRILVETDAPFLAPQKMRGNVNRPAYVIHTLEYLTSLRPEPPEVVEATIFENSLRFYGVPAPASHLPNKN